MSGSSKSLSFEIDVHPGEKLTLPTSLVESVGAGRWIVTFEPVDIARTPVRNHSAFLSGYAPEDEGLYDDNPGR